MTRNRRPIIALDMERFEIYLKNEGVSAFERRNRNETVWLHIAAIVAQGFKAYPLCRQEPKEPRRIPLGRRINVRTEFNKAMRGETNDAE